MPLRLKSLELHGYKTFASRMRFEFSERITAIVGPNGSGKSNIADALRWALGEQSYSILRGKKTEDMIFAGSDNRARAGMASVVLSFDNSDNWLPIDFSEVDLSRRAFRDGRNDYLINNQQVRLKDLNELLAQSGLSERTYTILGQGLVDASLALKADERRKLFEEAAGIGLYRSRRAEALKRLDVTNRNLDRVLDILAELKPRLRSLEKQAKKATEYQQVQKDLKSTLLEWYGYHWKNSQIEMNEAHKIFDEHKSKVEVARSDYQSIRSKYLGYRENLQSLRSRLNTWHRESSQIHSSKETLSLEMAVLEERRDRLEENRKDLVIESGRSSSEINVLKERFLEKAKELEHLQMEFQDAKDQLVKSQELLASRKNDKDSLEELSVKTKRENNININQLENLKVLEKELQNRLITIQADLDEKLVIIKDLEKDEKTYLQEKSSIEKHLNELENELENLHNQQELINKNLRKLHDERNVVSQKIIMLDAEESGLKTQLELFIHSEETFAGYAEGTKVLLESSKMKKLSSKIFALSSLVEIPSKFEAAISVSLGDFLDSIIFETEQDVEDAIMILESHEEGRATILPIEKLIYTQNPDFPLDAGVIGIASDLVSIESKYRPAIDFLLNKFIVVENRKIALKILRTLLTDMKVVTMNGDIYYANGPIRTGKIPISGLLSRKRSMKDIREKIKLNRNEKQVLLSNKESLDIEIEDLEKDLIENQAQFSNKEKEVVEAKDRKLKNSLKIDSTNQNKDILFEQQSRLQSEQLKIIKKIETNVNIVEDLNEKIQEKENLIKEQNKLLSEFLIDGLQEQVTYWTSQVAIVEHKLNDLRTRRDEYSTQLSKLETLNNGLEIKLQEYGQTIDEIGIKKAELRNEELEISQKLEKLQSLIEPAEIELENAVKQEEILQNKEAESQASLAKVERYNNQVQMDFERKQEAIGILRQKIEDDFGLVEFDYEANVDGPVPLPFEGMVEQLKTIDVLPPDLEETLSRQRLLLRRLGPVNPEAQKEYESVSERHTFLNSQLEDLKKAVIDTQQVIAELDEITRQEFLKTFTAVAEEFKSIFHRLFGGGSARLLLTDPDNLTDTGIDIEARLPGRREQGLALLSGGERSLTAIALIFSLLRVSPTPVCVMDEVDAMLDEANVGRFRNLLEELSQETQFIVITHNRNTVQAADIIYGVTMGMDSVSKVISLKLDQISEDFFKK
jgi:chromosome segregation protein